MTLEIRKRASNTIAATKNWIDKQNTAGAGERWVAKLFEELNSRGKSGVKHAICQNESLASRHYSCFTYNGKWVIAYRIANEKFIVCRFILGEMLY